MPFLDTLVAVEESNNAASIEPELYIKPMNSGIILHYGSAHPTATKHSIARNQFRRAIRNSNHQNAIKERRSIDKLRNLLLQNGHPNRLLVRHVRGPRKRIPGSDPKDLDPVSVRIIDPTLTVCRQIQWDLRSAFTIRQEIHSEPKSKTVYCIGIQWDLRSAFTISK